MIEDDPPLAFFSVMIHHHALLRLPFTFLFSKFRFAGRQQSFLFQWRASIRQVLL